MCHQSTIHTCMYVCVCMRRLCDCDGCVFNHELCTIQHFNNHDLAIIIIIILLFYKIFTNSMDSNDQTALIYWLRKKVCRLLKIHHIVGIVNEILNTLEINNFILNWSNEWLHELDFIPFSLNSSNIKWLNQSFKESLDFNELSENIQKQCWRTFYMCKQIQ